MADMDRNVAAFRRRTAWVLALRALLAVLVFGGFGYGTIVLLARVAVGTGRDILLWPLVLIVPCVLAAVWHSLKRIPDAAVVRALLDRTSDGGGLLMASCETQIGEWQGKLPQTRVPTLQYRNRRQWSLCLASLVFLAVSFLVPQRFVEGAGSDPLDVDNDVNRITEKVNKLEELEIIKQETAENLQQEITKIKSDASGDDPAKTWESLDHIERKVDEMGKQACQEALSELEKLGKAETAARAMSKGQDKLSSSQMADAMKELSEMLENTQKENAEIAEAMKQLGEACEGGQLSQEQLEQLAEALKEAGEGLKGKLGELSDSGLSPEDLAEMMKNAGSCSGGGDLADIIEQMGEGKSLKECLAGCSRPGRGGIARGRGDAAMTWTDGTDETGATFKEQALPPAGLSALRESKLVKISQGDPTASKQAGPDAGGKLSFSRSGGGSANTQTILPRHRASVRRYFQRDSKNSK